MKITKIKIKVDGKTPMLMNRFTDAAAMAATQGTRTSGPKATLDPKEDAKSRLYTDEKGKVIIPQPNLFRCIIDAGKFFKAGKSKVTTLKSSLIPAAISLDEIHYPLKHDGWSVDTRPIRIPATGGRILRHRPIFHKWGFAFEVELDEEIIPYNLFHEIIEAAGKRIGFGDFRPDCKGPFGKFIVTKFEKVKHPKSPTNHEEIVALS